MAFVKPQYKIGYSFECAPVPIRLALKMFADTYSPTIGFCFAGIIDALFLSALVPNPEDWLETWKKALKIQEGTIIVGDSEQRVYFSNRAWMQQLQLDLLMGNVWVDMPYPCQQLIGYGIPIPILE